MLRAWGVLLRLYPRKYYAEFSDEMQTVFAEASADARKQSSFAWIRLLAAETAGLLSGSAAEWLASVRRTHLAPQAKDGSTELDEVAAAELRIAANLRRMEYAIAHHQFP